MKSVKIVSIGTEVLMGNILNTNTYYLANELSMMGFVIYHHETVGDNRQRIENTLINSLNENDIVITIGGLGPTEDDLTKEVASKVTNRKLELNEDVKKHIEKYFLETKKACKSTYEMNTALIPVGSKLIENANGTAPGIIIEYNNKVLILLPGPPLELKYIWENGMKEYLISLNDTAIVSRTLKLCGIGETLVEEKLFDIIDNQNNPTIAPYAKTGQVHLRLTANGKNTIECNNLLDTIEQKINSIVGEYIYTNDVNETLESIIIKKCIDNKLTLSVCESITGGLLSHTLTNVPNASKVFKEGIITYANESKVNSLNINKDIIEKYGCISSECCYNMALELYKKTSTNITISTTGNAGPDGMERKKVGLVYIGICINGKVDVKEFNFVGTRDKIKELTVVNALNFARETICKFY
ncbi:MAG: competence/damage-inducible protein A [Eubacteriales bacterium]|nr:competence/damage-inducible protein A [Eubacteriales bacterium]